jgi:hypothetical protein
MGRWTKEQETELAREYARVGYRAGEQWPYPQDPEPTPEELLALLRLIPDGAGLTGYLATIAQRAQKQP